MAREGQPIDGKNNATWESIIDTLHSLADLLETGEDIVEVREDMRKDRRERKAKEKAERERKAAEEERLRQQQGQKSKNEPKKSQPSSSASIDFTKLNNLISQQVSFLKGLLASGEEATPAQHAQFNSLNSQYANEFNRLKAQIDALPDSSQRSQYYSQLASVNSRMNSEVDPLLAQGERAGIFKNL